MKKIFYLFLGLLLGTASIASAAFYTYPSISAPTGVNVLNKVLTGLPNGQFSPQVIPTAANSTFYFYGEQSTSTDSYLKMASTATTTKTDLFYNNVGSTQVLQNFITPVGVPNFNFIPAGSYEFHIHAKTTNPVSAELYAEIWEVDSNGVDIAKIGTTETTASLGGLSTSETEYRLFFVNPNVYNLASLNSRIEVKVWLLRNTSLHDVHLYVGGESDSHIAVPAASGGSASQWITTGSDIYYDAGNVGIGSTSPYSKLSVTGTTTLSDPTSSAYLNFTFEDLQGVGRIYPVISPVGKGDADNFKQLYIRNTLNVIGDSGWLTNISLENYNFSQMAQLYLLNNNLNISNNSGPIELSDTGGTSGLIIDGGNLTVGQASSNSNANLILHGKGAGVAARRGASLGWYIGQASGADLIGGYTFINQNKQLVFKPTVQSAATETGNAFIGFDGTVGFMGSSTVGSMSYANNFYATSTTATSTILGGLTVGTGAKGLTVLANNDFVGINTASPDNPFTVVLPTVSNNAYFKISSNTATAFNTYLGTTANNQYAWFTNIKYNGAAFVRDSTTRSAWRMAQVVGTTNATSNFTLNYWDPTGNLLTPFIVLGGAGQVGIATSTPSTALSVYGGGVSVNPGALARPTCDRASRGTYWNVFGAAGVADTFQVCQKDAADAYAWVVK